MGFEPTTSTLARLRSTPELYSHCCLECLYHSFLLMQEKFYIFCFLYTNTLFFLFKFIFVFCVSLLSLTLFI